MVLQKIVLAAFAFEQKIQQGVSQQGSVKIYRPMPHALSRFIEKSGEGAIS